MLNLIGTSDKLDMISSSAATLDVHVSYMDLDVTGTTGRYADPGTQDTAFSSAITQDICAAPITNKRRNVRFINVRNKHASLSATVTVRRNLSGTIYELTSVTLAPNDQLQMDEDGRFAVIKSTVAGQLINEALAAQGPGFATDTYLAGSNIVIPSGFGVGSFYRCVMDVSKTNVGTATPIYTVRIGSGVIGDTSRLVFTFGAGTAAADVANVELMMLFRSVGSGTAAVLQGTARAVTNLQTTGWSSTIKALQVTSSGFDSSTLVGQQIGVSYNGGASAVHTVQYVRSEFQA